MAATPKRFTSVALPRTGIRSVTVHLVLTGLSAVMLAFIFAPFGLWWLAYVALVPAGVLAVRSGSARRLAWTSFTVFWAWWLGMLMWVSPVTQGGHIVMSALMAGYWAAALVVMHGLHRRYRAAMILLLPMVWVSAEWLRGRFPAGGFGWFALGHSQGAFEVGQPVGRIIQTADLLGEQGVSLILAMTSGLIVDLLTRPIMRPIGHGKHRVRKTIRGGLILWITVLVGAWFYGQYRIGQWTWLTGPGPRIAVVQTHVPQDNKNRRSPQQDAQDWQRMVELTRQAAAVSPKPDLIVWPETVTPRPINPQAVDFFRNRDSYYSGSEVYHELIQSLTQSLGINLLVGSHAYEAFTDVTFPDGSVGPFPSRRYNSAYLYYADGQQAPMRYDKMHRVPFGEYIPWVDAMPKVKALFLKWFTPYEFDYSLVAGVSLTVFDIPMGTDLDAPPKADADTGSATDADATPPAWTVVRVVTPICYEDVVGRVVRRLVYNSDGTKRADLVINLTNSAWYPGHRQQPQQLQIATFRCIENRVPMARSVNGGISGFVDSIGRVGPVVTVGGRRQWVDGLQLGEPRLDTRETLYGRIGERPIACLSILTAVMWLWGMLKPGKSTQ